jgi:hypothetical protein
MLVTWQYCEWNSVHVLKSLTFRFFFVSVCKQNYTLTHKLNIDYKLAFIGIRYQMWLAACITAVPALNVIGVRCHLPSTVIFLQVISGVCYSYMAKVICCLFVLCMYPIR